MAVKEIPNDDGDMVEYYSCPMLWLNGARPVREYLEMREYLDTYPHTAKPFEELDPRFLAFDRYYRAKRAEYLELVKREG